MDAGRDPTAGFFQGWLLLVVLPSGALSDSVLAIVQHWLLAIDCNGIAVLSCSLSLHPFVWFIQPLWESWSFPFIWRNTSIYKWEAARPSVILRPIVISNSQSPNTRSPQCRLLNNPLLAVRCLSATRPPQHFDVYKYNSSTGMHGRKKFDSVVVLVGWNSLCSIAMREVGRYKYFEAMYDTRRKSIISFNINVM